jgi:hypothetical protein
VTIETVDNTGNTILGPIQARWSSQPEPLAPSLQNDRLVSVIDLARFVAARKCNVHSHEDQSVSIAIKYEGSPSCLLE